MPEVIFIRPSRPSTTFQALLMRLVELGIDFAFDDNLDLPTDLPPSLDGVRLIMTMPEDWETLVAKPGNRERLRAFVKAGGATAAGFVPIQDIMHQVVAFDKLERVRMDLTHNHPAMRRRLQDRPWQEVLKPVIPKLAGFRGEAWGDPTGTHVWSGLEILFDLTGDRRYYDTLKLYIDEAIAQGIEHGAYVGLVGYGFANAVRLWRDTGDSTYRDYLVPRVERHIREFTRLDGTITIQFNRWDFWCDAVMHLASAFVSVGVAAGNERFVEEGIKVVDDHYRHLFNPQTRLWHHGGRPGRRGPAPWSRGEGWALWGLCEALRFLPTDHAARGRLIGYLRESFEGLLAVQDEEGLFHQVLDDPVNSRPELTGSAMFLRFFSRARMHGWLDDSRLDPFLHKLARAVRGRFWNGWFFSGTCGASAYSTRTYYIMRPLTPGHTVVGTGAAATYMKAFGINECPLLDETAWPNEPTRPQRGAPLLRLHSDELGQL